MDILFEHINIVRVWLLKGLNKSERSVEGIQLRFTWLYIVLVYRFISICQKVSDTK